VTELYPFLAVRDVGRAVEFYAEAFDAVEEDERHLVPDGLSLEVDDPDAVAARAIAAGGREMFPSPTSRTGCGRAAWSIRSDATG